MGFPTGFLTVITHCSTNLKINSSQTVIQVPPSGTTDDWKFLHQLDVYGDYMKLGLIKKLFVLLSPGCNFFPVRY